MGYRLLPPAEADLDAIWLYVAKASGRTDVADRIIDAITDRLHLLGEYPQIGRRRDHDLRPHLRSFSVGEYVIIYRIAEAEAVILHIARGSRDIEALLSD